MYSMFHKILSTLMALLLLLSTISWKVEKHYCMGRLIDVALFSEAESCGMNMFLVNHDEGLKETKKICCDDEVIIVEGQDVLNIPLYNLEIAQADFLIVLDKTYFISFSDWHYLPLLNEQYPPPILVKDIHVLDEVFLI